MTIFFVIFSFQYLNPVKKALYDTAKYNINVESKNTANYLEGLLINDFENFERKTNKLTYASLKSNYQQEITDLYNNSVNLTNTNLMGTGFIDLKNNEKSNITFYNGELQSGIIDYNKLRTYANPDRFLKPAITIIRPAEFISDLTFTEEYAVLFLRTFVSGSEVIYLCELQDFASYFSVLTNNFKFERKYFFIASNDGYINTSNYGTAQNINEIFSSDNRNLDIFSDDTMISSELKLGNNNYFVIRSKLLPEEYNILGMNLYYLVDAEAINDHYFFLFNATLVYIIEIALASILLTCIFTGISWNTFQNYKLTLFEFNFSKTYTIVVDGKGKILRKNGLFKNLDSEKKKNLSEYQIMDDEQNLNEILRKLNFVVKVNQQTRNTITNEDQIIENYIRFTNIRHLNKYQLIGNNITEDYVKNQKLVYLSYYNPVCDILNRRALEDDLAKHLSNLKTNDNKSLVLLDIKEFRNINGLFGHDFGNEVLIHVTKQLKTILGPNDILYSMEGDNFALLISKPEDRGGIVKVCDGIFELFRQPIELSSNSIVLIVCIGVYNLEKGKEGFMTPKSVIDGAILANKHSKAVNNKHFYIYDLSLSKNVEKEAIMQEDLKHALFNNEFILHFQPQYDLLENKVIGFESLLRWNNPKYRLESPFKYIKIAERTGLINDIGHFVMVESFKLAKEIGADSGIHISVNVSPAQLLQTGFLAKFVSLFEEFQVPFDAIAIEITETFLMTSFQECISRLKYVREKGIKVYIDDFGTGYSSLLYLNELPIDFIKIDREFIKDLQTSKSSRIIVAKLIAMANDLGIKIVAEGVENAYQARFLLKNNCPYIQGWLISKAVDRDHVKEALKINVDYSEK